MTRRQGALYVLTLKGVATGVEATSQRGRRQVPDDRNQTIGDEHP